MITDGQHTKDSSETRFAAIILYDGMCVLCNWFVRMILRIDRQGRIGFAELNSPGIARADRDMPSDVDSVVLLEGDVVRVRSDAVFRVFELVGGVWGLLKVLRAFPVRLTDGVYDWIARRRRKIFGRYASCPAPEVRYRDRFLT